MRCFTALMAFLLVAPQAFGQSPRTVAEKTDYQATSLYADVIAFCEEIAKRGPIAKLDYFGTSHEGRKLPLLVISDPPVASAAEARKAGKLVVMAFANIHAGEVDGKEALLALSRDLTDRKDHPLLKDLVILLVPILNADGNEKISPKNRPRENGPADGAGVRENSQGFDLNRDFIKLDTPEARALVKLINAWDPAMIIDCHTTNGSRHRHALTYDGPRYPSHSASVAEWANNELFPDVTRKVKASTGYDICPYGNFSRDRTKWESYPSGPRFGVQYFALRDRVGVLSESYSYASFKDRVKASHAFVTACFEVAAAKRAELAKAVAPAQSKRVPLRTMTEGFPTKLGVLGFEEIEKDGKRVATDKPKDYSLEYVARVVPSESVELPYAYLIPASNAAVIENMQRHGIAVQELREDIDLDIEVFPVTGVEKQAQAFQKRSLVTSVAGNWKAEKKRVPAGTFVVKSAQPLGRLAGYLLEPRSEDGLTTWDFFGNSLKINSNFPIMRLTKEATLKLGDAPKLSQENAK